MEKYRITIPFSTATDVICEVRGENGWEKLDEAQIALVMNQAHVGRTRAIKAICKSNGDLANAIMDCAYEFTIHPEVTSNERRLLQLEERLSQMEKRCKALETLTLDLVGKV